MSVVILALALTAALIAMSARGALYG